MEEKIIVSLTSYGKRLNNLPIVLDTIYAQTLPPDLVVLNLAYEEILPKEVEIYLRSHNVEVNRVPDTKVYKKIIPTLKKYPNDCIIGIDDDWLYPKQMIEDFMNIHKKYPNNPISGNKIVIEGIVCHCGCASLVKKVYLEKCLDLFNEEVFTNCKSDDIFYSYCATKSGHPYVRTEGLYFTNMKPYNSIDSYSEAYSKCYSDTMNYLNCIYGRIANVIKMYLQIGLDDYIIDLIDDVEKSYRCKIQIVDENCEVLKNSHTYKLGHFLLYPFKLLKKISNLKFFMFYIYFIIFFEYCQFQLC